MNTNAICFLALLYVGSKICNSGGGKDFCTQIRNHMRNNLRRTLSDDKRRADKTIADHGGTYQDYRPKYVKPGVWSRLCEYWCSDAFKKKSIAGKAARKKLKRLTLLEHAHSIVVVGYAI